MPPRHQGAGGRVTGGNSVISRQQLIGLVGITLMWGINWPMMKIALSEVSPMYFRGVTMGLGGLWLLMYFGFQGLRLWPQTLREWRDIALLGIPNMFLWHAQKDVGTALVQLTTQLAFAASGGGWCHIKLKEGVAGHERHLGQVGHVPSAHDDAA